MVSRFVVAAIALVLALAGASRGASQVAATPVLGHAWAPDQGGYGHARPTIVFNGGDPTGLVRQIRWKKWGRSTAVGEGRSTYVWPGTAVADNPPLASARIVAFHLGTCRGRPSYNAIEWYFPAYGDTFDPSTYINACTGTYVGFTKPTLVSCANVPIHSSQRTATHVEAAGVGCGTARTLIADSPALSFNPPKRPFIWHFRQSGFRCGSSGDGRDLTSLGMYACGLNRRLFFFALAPTYLVRRHS